MKGRLKVSAIINELLSGGKPVYTLTITLSDPKGFTEAVTKLSPEYAFVISRAHVNEPLSNPFERVCSIDDFFTIPKAADYGLEEGSLFRSSTYYRDFPDHNSSLLFRDKIIDALRVFLNNLNAYSGSYSGEERIKEFILPDYEETELDALIGQYREHTLTVQKIETEIEVLTNTVAPMLGSHKLIYGTLDELADTLLTHATEAKASYINFTSLQTQALNLKDTFLEIQGALGNSNSQLQNIKSDTGSLQSKIMASDSISADLKGSLLKHMSDINLRADSGVSTFVAPNLAAVQAKIQAIVPSVEKIKNMDLDSYIDLESIKKIVKLVKDFGTSIDAKIAENSKKIDVLTNEKERIKGLIQSVQSRMKFIRPSIDAVNPETAWYFTVNISGD